MAINGFESFDIYGTSIAALVLRGYTTGGSSISLTTSNVRTGGTCLRFDAASGSLRFIERVIPTSVAMLVNSCAMRIEGAPASANSSQYGLGIGTNTNCFEYKCNVNNDRGLCIYAGDTEIGRSAPNLITIGSYSFVEFKVRQNNAGINTGIAEARINGVTFLTVTGLNIVNPVTRLGIGARTTNNAVNPGYNCNFDDWNWIDNTTSDNNDYLGDRRVFTCMVDSDQTPMQWGASSGTTRFDLINELNPNDAGFIIANTAGDQSQFGLQNVPVDVNTIAAVQMVARAFKQSAGPATFRIGVNSNSNIVNSAEFNPNTTVAYYSQIFNQNPDGNISWNRTAFDNTRAVTTRGI